MVSPMEESACISETLRRTQYLHVISVETGRGGANFERRQPWVQLRNLDYASLPRIPVVSRYMKYVEIAKSIPDEMLYIRNWLKHSTKQLYNDWIPKQEMHKHIIDIHVHVCIEYHHLIYLKKNDDAVQLHRKLLKDVGYGHSVHNKSGSGPRRTVPTTVPPQNQPSQPVQQQSAVPEVIAQPLRSRAEKNRLKEIFKQQQEAGLVIESEISPPTGNDDTLPLAKKPKMDSSISESAKFPGSSKGDKLLNPQQSPRGVREQIPIVSTHQDSRSTNMSVRQTRSQTRPLKPPTRPSHETKASVSPTSPKDTKKRKAAEDVQMDALTPTKRRRGKDSDVVKMEGDQPASISVDSEETPSRRALRSTTRSSTSNLDSPNCHANSVMTRRHKRKFSVLQDEADSVASAAAELQESSESMPSGSNHSEPLPSAPDDYIVEDAANNSQCSAPVPAEPTQNAVGLDTILQTLQQSATQAEPDTVNTDVSDPEVLEHATPVVPLESVDSSRNVSPLTAASAAPLTESNASTDITSVKSPAFVPVHDIPGSPALTSDSTIPSSDGPHTPDSIVIDISSPILFAKQPLPRMDTPVVSQLTLDTFKAEEAVADDLEVVPSPPLVRDISMTVVPTTVASEQLEVLEEEEVRFPRTPLGKFPPIWSESRQELCESFDWFRSYQGGVYFINNTVKGYLLGAFGAKRDIFKHDGRLIVSHGGGRAESIHGTKGNITTVAASDQLLDDKSVRALRQNYLKKRPLALVIDEKYGLFPFELAAHGITYAVLGFYTISDMWAEYQQANNAQGRVVRWKFAFRYCDNQDEPWWTTPNEAEHQHNAEQETLLETSRENSLSNPGSSEPTPVEASCMNCRQKCKQVFSMCWTCLNPDCGRFWRRGDGSFLPEQLSYHPGFLVLPPPVPISSGSKLKPVYPIPADARKAKKILVKAPTSYPFTRGFHCTDCGRLSCRSKWEKWECAHCHHSLTIIGNVRRAKEFWGKDVISTGFRDNYVNKISGIQRLPARKFPIGIDGLLGNVQTFLLPHNRGMIHHIQPGTPMGAVQADKIFEDYQDQASKGDLLFRRWPLRAHKCRGTLLTNYFSQNTGHPYQYVGGDEHTVPFASAPSAVLAARDLLQDRVCRALGRSDASFNEILSAAYMEKQKMAFHSDNEAGLGPLVAGLSMGAAAMMHFRLAAKHDPERRQRGVMMSFNLRHGDILVMDGSGVQEYYEHTVVPTNFRIAATARQITPAHR